MTMRLMVNQEVIPIWLCTVLNLRWPKGIDFRNAQVQAMHPAARTIMPARVTNVRRRRLAKFILDAGES